jgi:hypothetical protein
MRSLAQLDLLWHDVRYSLRTIRRTGATLIPAFRAARKGPWSAGPKTYTTAHDFISPNRLASAKLTCSDPDRKRTLTKGASLIPQHR